MTGGNAAGSFPPRRPFHAEEGHYVADNNRRNLSQYKHIFVAILISQKQCKTSFCIIDEFSPAFCLSQMIEVA